MENSRSQQFSIEIELLKTINKLQLNYKNNNHGLQKRSHPMNSLKCDNL